ncbi:MAG: hypothetical protein AAGU27_16110 [Dehalobacterium sp.]
MSERTIRYLNIVYFISQMLTIIGFMLRKEYGSAFNPIATSFFYLGIVLGERFTEYKLKNYIRIILIITLTGHSLIGEYFHAYHKSVYFDKALHVFGTFSFSLFAYDLFINFIEIKTSRPVIFTFILVSLMGIWLGTFFELVEFSLDLIFKENNQNGLLDTDLDLLCDLIGALLAGFFAVKSRNIILK